MTAEHTAHEQAVEWTVADAARTLVAPGAGDHKYSRGVVGLMTGSARYPGAAVLGAEAALRSGPGMVRFDGPESVTRLVLARRPEVVPGQGRVQSLLIGSGMDSAEALRRWDQYVAATGGNTNAAVVLDAGVLSLLGERLRRPMEGSPGAVSQGTAADPAIVITPHAGELATLMATTRSAIEADPMTAAVQAAARWNCVVVLKGSTTVIATTGGRTLTVPVTTHWLASAGTGDVLAGCLAALVASAAARASLTGHTLTDSTLAEVAATAVVIHAEAAVEASAGGPLVALDLATQLSPTVARLLAR